MTVLNQINQTRLGRLRYARKVEREIRPQAGIAVLAAVSDGLFGKRERMATGRLARFPMAAVVPVACRAAA